MENSDSDKKAEDVTPKDSEPQEKTEETQKLLEKAGLRLTPVTEEENKKEEPITEQHQEEIPASIETEAEEKISKEQQEELKKEEEEIEIDFQEHVAKNPQERRSEKGDKQEWYAKKKSWMPKNALAKWFESEVKHLGISENEGMSRAVLHWLNCSHSGKEFARDLTPRPIFLASDEPCTKCKTVMKEHTLAFIFRATKHRRILCPACKYQLEGDPATLELLVKNTEQEHIYRVVKTAIKEAAEKMRDYRDKETLHELVLSLESLDKLTEPTLKILSSILKQYFTNQNNIPAKFTEYVNSKLGNNGEGGRPHFLRELADQKKDPSEELLKICELAWIANRSYGFIGDQYHVKDKTIYRLLHELEPIKEQILEFIRGKNPEIPQDRLQTLLRVAPMIHDLFLKAEEQSASFDAILKTREMFEKHRRKKLLKGEYSEEAQGS